LSKVVGDAHQQCLTPPENAAIIAALLDVEAKEKKIARQGIQLQVVATLFGASIAFGIKGAPQFAIAVFSGGAISVVNAVLLAWRMARAALHPAHEAHHQLRLMYFYAAERYLVVVLLLCVCFAVLKLPPPALLGGFVMGQAIFLAGRLFLRRLG
jgi:ATP synthase protein I